MKIFTNTGRYGFTGRLSFLALSLVTMLAVSGGIAIAQPVNDNFASATTLNGLSGSTTGNNAGATMEPGEVSPLILTDGNGTVDVTNSIWFQWTAPQDGNVTFDTIGSVDNTFNSMATVLGVWTGSSLATLNPTGADDNSGGNNNSRLTFFAKAGTTYYISLDLDVDTAGLPGNYVLNWNEQGAPQSGTFQFTSAQYQFSKNEDNAPLDDRGKMLKSQARATITRVMGASGMVEVGYSISDILYTNITTTNIFTTNTVVLTTYTNTVFATNTVIFTNTTFVTNNMVVTTNTTYTTNSTITATPSNYTNTISSVYNIIQSYQNFNLNGGGFYNPGYYTSAFGIVTNVNGQIVGSYFTNNLPYVTNAPDICSLPATSSQVINADQSITTTVIKYSCTNVFVTNIISSITGRPATNNASLPGGQLVFNDFEMNQDILVPVPQVSNLPNLVNPIVNITITNVTLDPAEDPSLPAPVVNSGRSSALVAFSAGNAAGPNSTVYGVQALTNSIINFERSTLRCDKTVTGSGVAYVYITLNGSPVNAVTAFYRIDHANADDDYNTFNLQAGSDYARPNNATKYIANNDFTSVSGSVTFPAHTGTLKQAIQIPITQDNLVKFNQDLQLQLYWPDGYTVPAGQTIGNISTCDLTILLTTQPAGAVDNSYNPENNITTFPANNTGPGANGVVYASAFMPTNGETVIGGDFTYYNNNAGLVCNHVALISTNGQLDTAFTVNNGSGFDADVNQLALDTNGNIIAVGGFHSFNGQLRNGIARLLANGSLDTTFNPGFGANSTVWATAIQPDGKILVAGDFTVFNHANYNYIARLNPDGSLDTTFNPGIGPNSDVYAVAVQTNGTIIIGGEFTTVDNASLNYIASLNADGSLNSSFNPGAGADNVVNAVAVQTNGAVLVAGAFGQINNQGGAGIARLNPNGSVDGSFNVGSGADDIVNSLTLQSDGNILIGGSFTTINQTRRVGIARLYANGWVDTSFMDTAYNQFAGVPNPYYNLGVNPHNTIYTISEQLDGNIVIGGSFSQVGGGGGLPNIYYTTTFDREELHPRANIARLIGGSTVGPGNVELSSGAYSANNNVSSLFVSLDRTNGTLGAVSATVAAVPLGTGPGYAANGVDYTFNPANPTWGVSWSSPTWMLSDGLFATNNNEANIAGGFAGSANPVTINIISNNNANASLNLGLLQPQQMDTFFLGGTSSAGPSGFGDPLQAEGENIPLGVALGNALSPLTIIHNPINPGTFNFSLAYYYVAEGVGNAVITVTRTGGTDNTVTVQYNTANGTALAGTDYTAKSGKLTFNAGSATATTTLSIPIINGSIARPDRIFNVNIFNPGGGATLGSITNAQVEIVNGNYQAGFAEFINGAFVSTNTQGYGVNENANSALISVARLGGAVGALNVSVVTAGGTAVNGVNYTGITNTLIWTNGDASVKTIAVPVIDDNVVTSNLTVNLSLYGATLNGASATNLLGLTTNAVLTITNTDSAGMAQFTTASYSVNENAGYAIVPVIRTGGSVGTLSVNYASVDGTAVAGVNYGAVSGTLQFAAGQVSTNFIVNITNLNSTWISPLNFQLILSNAIPTNGLGTPSVAQMNINGSRALNVPPGQPVTDYNPSAGFNSSVQALALQGNGKLLAGGAFTLANGISRQHIARLNTDGTLDTTFSSYLPTSGANGAVQAIVWQTNGLIVVGGAFTTFNNVNINRIARLNVNGSLDSSFNAGAGVDNPIYAIAQNYVNGQRRIVIGGAFTLYNGVARNSIAQLMDNGTLDTSFVPSSGANGIVYAIATQPDGKIIIGGDFTNFNGVFLNHIARLNVNGSVDTTFNIGTGASDSVRALAIQADGKILIGGLFTNVNGLNFNRLARLNVNGSVDTSFIPTTGANDKVSSIAVQPDTRILVGGDFTQFNGVTRNRITRLNPNGTTDPTINFGTGADGSVFTTLIEPDGNIDLGGGFLNYNSQSHASIVQLYGGSLAGSGALQFSSATSQANENSVHAFVTVIRTGGTSGNNPDGSGDIFVQLKTSDETAHAGVNYVALTTNIDFPAGEVAVTIPITVIDDGNITSDLTVGLNLSNPTAPALIGSQPTNTLTILNTDNNISFSSATYAVAKNLPGGMAPINIIRQGGTNTVSTVIFNTITNGTATPNTDYTPVTNLVVTFNPGITNVLAMVPINNNGLNEGNTTLGLTLSGAVNSTLIPPTNAVLTIIDTTTAPGSLGFSAANYTVNSTDGTATLTVIRTNGLNGSVSATYTTIPGTATPGVNYTTSSGNVNFISGQATAIITVPLVQNTLVQGPVTFSVVLSNPTSGATLNDPTNATVTILSQNFGVGFLNATNYISETNAIGNIFIQRIGNTNIAFQVNYATYDGTAKAGVNYQSTAGTVAFAIGETLKTIQVPLINNQDITNLTFGMALSSPTAGASLGIPTNALIVLQAGRAGLSFTNAATTVAKNSLGVIIEVVCSNPSIEPVVTGTNVVPLTVSYSTADGTAQAGVDYVSTSGSLVFTNGIGTNYFTVPIINNSLVNGNRAFTVNLLNPTAPGKLVAPFSQQVTIVNNNAGFSFSSATYTVLKTGISAPITVIRVDNTNTTSSVNFSTADGTAVGGVDYVPTNGVFVFTNGETSKTFPVSLIANTTVQPDKTVLIQLSNPTNGFLIAPSAATLTIHDTSGSLVVPSGSALVSESFTPANGIIDPNERVTLLFGFRVSGGNSIGNVVATLLATNGVTSPSSAQNYGTLVARGPSVSRQFSFTANGTNGQQIAATFQLQSGSTNLGTALFTYNLGTWTATYYNTNPIIINDNAIGTPYPSLLTISNVGGAILKTTLTLTNMSHRSPSDIDILLVSPAQKDTLIMAGVGGQNVISHVTLTFDDAATNSLTSGQIISGTNKPTAFKVPVFP